MKSSSLIARRILVARFVGVVALASAALAMAAPPAGDAAAQRWPDAPRPVNAVVHWNDIAADAFAPSQGTNPMAQSRILAILHASIHDALNAIDRRYGAYTAGLKPAPGANPDVAVAAPRARCWCGCCPSRPRGSRPPTAARWPACATGRPRPPASRPARPRRGRR